MGVIKTCAIATLLCACTSDALDVSLRSVDNPFCRDYSSVPLSRRASEGLTTLIKELVPTIVLVHRYLVSWDSFALLSATFPLFIGSRMIDVPLQNYFYDRATHRNCSQFPSWFKPTVEKGIGIPMAILMSYSLFCRKESDRKMGRIFATIMPFVIFGKDIIKTFKFDFCRRPWSQKFSATKQAHGGFPSGHMAEAVYMAAFFGMHYGPSHAVPLGIVAGLLGVTFINCNRHYLSQIVAGAVWGVLFAVASYKLMKPYKENKFSCEIGFDDAGSPALEMRYRF